MFVYILFKRENIYVTSHSYPSLATCPTLKVLVRAKPDVILVERPPQSSPLVLYGTKECGRPNEMRVWRGESIATISKPSQYYIKYNIKTFSCSVFFFSQPSFREPLILIKVVLDELGEQIAEFFYLLFSLSNYFHMRTSYRYRVM